MEPTEDQIIAWLAAKARKVNASYVSLSIRVSGRDGNLEAFFGGYNGTKSLSDIEGAASIDSVIRTLNNEPEEAKQKRAAAAMLLSEAAEIEARVA